MKKIAMLGLLLAACTGTTAPDDGQPGAADATAAGVPDAEPVGACATCSPTEDCCEFQGRDLCLSVMQDRNNCGGCDLRCDPAKSDRCEAGDCMCADSPACGDADVCCGDGCQDLSSDDANCGACGNQCPVNTACVSTECVCAAIGADCGEGEACCADGCSDLSDDDANCGLCGRACGADEVCQSFTCICEGAGAPCFGSTTCCPSGCANLLWDSSNCGTCGYTCGPSAYCSSGTCISIGDGGSSEDG